MMNLLNLLLAFAVALAPLGTTAFADVHPHEMSASKVVQAVDSAGGGETGKTGFEPWHTADCELFSSHCVITDFLPPVVFPHVPIGMSRHLGFHPREALDGAELTADPPPPRA